MHKKPKDRPPILCHWFLQTKRDVYKRQPQYNVGFGKFKDLLNEIESRAHGLFFAGSFRDGISLGDSIVSGVNIAESVGKTFLTTDGHGL